ncbi:ABC transporter permease [Anaeromassilibacillus sp. An200]|nr:ABC transporter permease subunit [Anaeromassilibacillus sp. An200]OUP12824.1 sugar ABC transporter permease [Anaeromassilibacillus sp. An200]
MKNTKERGSIHRTLLQMKRSYMLYIFLLPAVILVAIFCYAPMYGVLMAFQNYSPSKGILGSPWVGLKWFETFFNMPRFWQILGNTLTLSVYSLLVGFPIPIILALMINSVESNRFKRVTQTVTYMPHFISTVVLVGMLTVFLSPRSGFLNHVLELFGAAENTYYMGVPDYFSHIYVWSGVWQDMGWNSIIYLAALTGVDQALHEAAQVDGATKLQRVWHIDLPAIIPTMVILLIMSVGNIMSVGYEKVFLMQNDLNIMNSEVISTYVYKIGLTQQQFSYSSAIGLFNNGINFILLVAVNKLSAKLSGSSLW